MSSTGYKDDILDMDVSLGGGRPRGCMWMGSICMESPTHQITIPHGETEVPQAFCERHYVLTMRHLVDVHLPECQGEVASHALSYGPIEGRLHPTLGERFAEAKQAHQDNCQDGINLLRAAIAERADFLGRADREVLGARAVLGKWLLDCGDEDEAFFILVSVLEDATRNLGREHPFTLEALGNLANAYSTVGPPAKARETYRQLMVLSEETLGPKHPKTLEAIRRHAIWQAREGDLDSAAQQLSALRPILAEIQHPYYEANAELLAALASIHKAKKRWIEAGELFNEDVQMKTAIFGADHEVTKAARENRWKVVRWALGASRGEPPEDEETLLVELQEEYLLRLQLSGLTADVYAPHVHLPLLYSAKGAHQLAVLEALDYVTYAPRYAARSLRGTDRSTEEIRKSRHLLGVIVDSIPSRRAAQLLLTALLEDYSGDKDQSRILAASALAKELRTLGFEDQ